MIMSSGLHVVETSVCLVGLPFWARTNAVLHTMASGAVAAVVGLPMQYRFTSIIWGRIPDPFRGY
jgi:purine-cytosine permease-like protein